MKEFDIDELKRQQQQADKSSLEFTFYLLTALNSAGYIAYVLVFYFIVKQAVGGESNEIWALLVLAFSMLLEAILEIPTGIVGDRYGHQKSVFLSFVFLAIHSLFYLSAAFFLLAPVNGINWVACILVILAEILLALGTALQTGSLNSWFVVKLKNLDYKDAPLHTYMSRRRLVTNLVWLIIGTIILLIGDHNIRLTVAFGIGIISYALAAVFTQKLAKSKTPSISKEPSSLVSLNDYMWEEFNGAISEIFKNRKLAIITLTHAVFWTLAVILTYFWQEILHFEKNDKENLTVAYAVTWLLIAFARILGSKLSERVKPELSGTGDHRASSFITGQILLAFPILFIFYFGQVHYGILTLGAILLALSRVGQEFSKPISMAWTHEEIKNNKFRATTESLIEAAAGFVIVLIAVPLMLLQLKLGKEQIVAFTDSQIKNVVIILASAVLIFNIPLTWLIFRNNGVKRESRTDELRIE